MEQYGVSLVSNMLVPRLAWARTFFPIFGEMHAFNRENEKRKADSSLNGSLHVPRKLNRQEMTSELESSYESPFVSESSGNSSENSTLTNQSSSSFKSAREVFSKTKIMPVVPQPGGSPTTTPNMSGSATASGSATLSGSPSSIGGQTSASASQNSGANMMISLNKSTSDMPTPFAQTPFIPNLSNPFGGRSVRPNVPHPGGAHGGPGPFSPPRQNMDQPMNNLQATLIRIEQNMATQSKNVYEVTLSTNSQIGTLNGKIDRQYGLIKDEVGTLTSEMAHIKTRIDKLENDMKHKEANLPPPLPPPGGGTGLSRTPSMASILSGGTIASTSSGNSGTSRPTPRPGAGAVNLVVASTYGGSVRPDYRVPPEVQNKQKWISDQENARSEVLIKNLKESTHGRHFWDPTRGAKVWVLDSQGRAEEKRWAMQALRLIDPTIEGKDIDHWGRFKTGKSPRVFVVGFLSIDRAQNFLRQCQMTGKDEIYVRSKSKYDRNKDKRIREERRQYRLANLQVNPENNPANNPGNIPGNAPANTSKRTPVKTPVKTPNKAPEAGATGTSGNGRDPAQTPNKSPKSILKNPLWTSSPAKGDDSEDMDTEELNK